MVEQPTDMARQQDNATGSETVLPQAESASRRVATAARSRSVPGSRSTSPPIKTDESAFAKLDPTFLLPSTARRQLTHAAGAAAAADNRGDVRPSTSTVDEFATPRGQETSEMRRNGGADDGSQVRRNGGADDSLTLPSRRDSLLPRLLADDEFVNQRQALTTCEFVNEDQMLDARLQVLENKHEARTKMGDDRLSSIEKRLADKMDKADDPTIPCDTMQEEIEEYKDTMNEEVEGLKETVEKLDKRLTIMSINSSEAQTAMYRAAEASHTLKEDVAAMTHAVTTVQEKMEQYENCERQVKSLAEATEANNKTVRQTLSTLLERVDILTKKQERSLPMQGSAAGGDTQYQITTETPAIPPGHTERRTYREEPGLRDPRLPSSLPVPLPGISVDNRMPGPATPARLNQVEDLRLDYDDDRRRDYRREDAALRDMDPELIRSYNAMAQQLGQPTLALPAHERRASRWEDSHAFEEYSRDETPPGFESKSEFQKERGGAFNRRKGPYSRGLIEIVPNDKNYAHILSYRTYRLLKPARRYYTNPKKNEYNTKALKGLLGSTKFDGSEPITILDFLCCYADSADRCGLHEDEAFTCLRQFLAGPAATTYRTTSSSAQSSPLAVHDWPSAVNHLLTKYASDWHIREALDALTKTSQKQWTSRSRITSTA